MFVYRWKYYSPDMDSFVYAPRWGERHVLEKLGQKPDFETERWIDDHVPERFYAQDGLFTDDFNPNNFPMRHNNNK